MASEKLNAAQIAALNYVNTLFDDGLLSTSAIKSVYDEVSTDNETTKRQLDTQASRPTYIVYQSGSIYICLK